MNEMNPLKRWRVEKGYTLAALSEKTGIAVDTINRLENGKRKANLKTLFTLARALEINPDALLSLEGSRVGINKKDNLDVKERENEKELVAVGVH